MSALLAVVMLECGCASRPRPTSPVAVAPTPPPATRPALTAAPIIDIARGGGGVPLEEAQVPQNNEQLKESLLKAYSGRFVLPENASPVTLQGNDTRSLELLKIDLSNSVVRDSFRPRQYQAPAKPEPGIAVRRFEYIAAPLLYQNGQTHWRLWAEDAYLSLLRNPNGKNTLTLTDAREGGFEFTISLADLRPMLLKGSMVSSNGAFKVSDADVRFTSDNPRNVTLDMKITAALFFVPTTFQMHVRADIDPWCNVKLSELSCQGLDAGGSVVAVFIDTGLQKQNGKLLPLVRWPGDKVVLTDVQFRVDESLTITARFARDQAAEK